MRAAYLRLLAARSGVHAARADRLPALRLTASGGYSSKELSDLLDNWIAQLGASLVGPVIDGRRRKAEVDRTRAVADERLAAYRGAVLHAVREVEDALAVEAGQETLVAALERQRTAAERAYAQASLRHRQGVESYLPVLTALNNVQRVERQLADAALARAAARIRLYRSLAGGWGTNTSQNEETTAQ